MEEDRHAVRSTVSRDGLTVMESYSPKFHDRTVENARWADFTVAFAVDFTSPGERLTATAAGEEYLPFDLPHSGEELEDEGLRRRMATILARRLESRTDPVRLNVAGSTAADLSRHGISQEQADAFITDVLGRAVDEGLRIQELRTGGQSGIDEAGTKAALALGIPASQVVPRGFLYLDESGKPHWNRDSFLSRFEGIRPYGRGEDFDVREAMARVTGEGREMLINPCRGILSLMPGCVVGDILGAPYRERDARVPSFAFFAPNEVSRGVHHHCQPTANSAASVAVCGWLLNGDRTDAADLRRRLGEDIPLGTAGVAAALSVIGIYTSHLLEARALARTALGAFRMDERSRQLCEAAVMATFMAAHGERREDIDLMLAGDYSVDVPLAKAGLHASRMLRDGKSPKEINSDLLQNYSLAVVAVPADEESCQGPQQVTMEQLLPRTMQMKEQTVFVNGEAYTYEEPTGRRSLSVKDLLPVAYAAFSAGDSFESCVRNAIAVGGDSPSIAALAGALASAYYGGVPKEMASRCSLLMDPSDSRALEQFVSFCTGESLEPVLKEIDPEMVRESRRVFAELCSYCDQVRADLARAAGCGDDIPQSYDTACYPEREGNVIRIYDHGVVDGIVALDPRTHLLKVSTGGELREGDYRDADWCREHVFDRGKIVTYSLADTLPKDWEQNLKANGVPVGPEERASLQRLMRDSGVYTRDLDGLKAAIARACLDEGVGIGDEMKVSNVDRARQDMSKNDIRQAPRENRQKPEHRGGVKIC